jgi:hypothetical protein
MHAHTHKARTHGPQFIRPILSVTPCCLEHGIYLTQQAAYTKSVTEAIISRTLKSVYSHTIHATEILCVSVYVCLRLILQKAFL